MLWNRFDSDRDMLNLYLHPNFEPDSGISDRNELIAHIEQIMKNMEGESHQLIKAKAIEYLLSNCAIEVNPIDWFGINFCGWITHLDVEKADKYCYKEPLRVLSLNWENTLPFTEEYLKATENIVDTGAGAYWPDYCHSVPDWDSIIGLGYTGLLARVKKNHRLKIDSNTITPEQELYYTTVEMTYEAILRFLNRILECAKKHITDDEKMPIMVECLMNICTDTPKTLYQYLMLIYLHHLIQQYIDIIHVRSLGNLDVDGYKYYINDLKRNRLTKENVKELFRYFYEKFTNQLYIHAQPLYFGGIDENGNSLINELSYLMLEAHDESCITSPKLFIKVMPNTPDEFIKKALDMIRRGKNAIVFINEELGMKISRSLGRTEEETRRLVGTGCNNFASRGKETTPEHMYVNLLKGIELVFGNGKDPLTGAYIGCETGNIEDFITFDDFRNAYIKQTDYLIDKAFVISDFYDDHLLDINPALIYSGTMPDSVESGKDAYFNGVKYNNTLMFLSCHASAMDSLIMVKKYVYDKKVITLPELKKALENDWVGYEEMRETILNDCDKFGNDNDEIDNYELNTLYHFTDKVNGRRNHRGGRFVVNGESITFSHVWAEKCGATPDGRKKGDLLSKNMSAAIGQDHKGITALIKSVTKIDGTRFPYGCPFDYMLHPSTTKGEDGLEAMLGLLRTFMKRGGYGFQGNVQDATMLRDAQIHPENYKNLQVRISGWSWFFTQMEKEFQDEFIRRAEIEEKSAC